MRRCILAVDQSTQGTKGLLFDQGGRLLARADRPHRQIITPEGWVEHDPREILDNTLAVCGQVLKGAELDSASVTAVALTNQRETSLLWDRVTGQPLANAVVWQCARAAALCRREELRSQEEIIHQKTGIPLSPYFPAPKFRWLMENLPQAPALAARGRLACGTMDAWLLWNLTGHHRTDFSNASRTQLFNLHTLTWDRDLCRLFQVPPDSLPEVCMSDSLFGETDLGGLLPRKVPVHGVLGDSHGALLGQNCRCPGQGKATYGTGSSVMMHIGDRPRLSRRGLVTSLAWGLDGRVEYVLEGNLNYTGAVISWLKQDVGLIATEAEATDLALQANPADRTFFVPAFTGLGAPYWDSRATGVLTGITRTTGRAEIARACLDSIAWQIRDLVTLMGEESGMPPGWLRADGGPTASSYLMQFQADITGIPVQVPQLQELSAFGAAMAAATALGFWDPEAVSGSIRRRVYTPAMEESRRHTLQEGWQQAIRQALTHG